MTPNCDRLAIFLEANKASLMGKWLVEARGDVAVLSNDLNKLELTDHIPQLFDTVVAALRNQCNETKSDVQGITARHTVIRWVQNYDLRAVLREVSLLRIEFTHLLLEFDRKHLETREEERLLHAVTIHQILDDIVLDAAETYIMLKNRNVGDR